MVEKHNTWSSCPSSCSQLYRLSVYLLFERDSYFGCENETTSSNSLPRLVGIFSPYWSIDWVGCSTPPWSYDNFLLQRKSFHEFCGINLVFSISFVVIWHAVLGHSDLMSWRWYLTIKYAFAHNEMFTKTRVIVLSVWRLDPKHSWLLFSESRVMVIPVVVLKVTLCSSIICLQKLLYREARRHEKRVLDLQFQKRTESLKVNYFSNNI